jgi:hypothetical protein
MPIFRTPYDTLVGKNLNMKNIQDDLIKGIISDNLALNTGNLIDNTAIKPIGLMGNCPIALKIPFFTNPYSFFYKKQEYMAMDYRPYTVSLHPNSCMFDNVRIRSASEYSLALHRQITSIDWLVKTPEDIKSTFKFSILIFTKWISQIITQRFNLYPDETMYLQIITSFYYQSLFENMNVFSEHTKQKFAIHTIKNTKARPDIVFKVFDKINEINGIEDYCRLVIEILENVKLQDLNAPLLITLIGNSWFGINAKEILAIGLEYPPTFIALLNAAAIEKSYKHTMLSDIIQKQQKNSELKEFTDNFKVLIDNYTKVSQRSLEDLEQVVI